MVFVKLINGSSRKMEELQDNSIHLCVTSPPYLDAIDYNRDNPENIGNYTGMEYYKLMYDVYSEVYRVLQPGRKFALNVQDIPSTEETTGLDLVGFRSVLLCEKIGFELIADIVWTKGRNRAGGTPMGTIPFPASPVILGNWEHVFIFRKKGKADYSHVTVDMREPSKLTTQEIADYIYATWDIRPEMNREHPAPFPLELPTRLIKLYSFAGEIVLEPFTGSGTTFIAAKNLRRSIVGYELEYKFCKMAMSNIVWNQQYIDGTEAYRYDFIRRGVYDEVKPGALL
jgi:DNA modification methylase